MIASVLKVLMTVMKRGLAGFVAGFIVACFALVVLGMMPPHGGLNTLELERQNHAVSLAFYIACCVAFVSVLVGGMRLSKYWLWFFVTFGVICLIPFWTHKSGILPLGAIYVNWGFWDEYRIPCLAVHGGISLLLAAMVHWASLRLWGKRSHITPHSTRHGQP